ncbi:MAG TPA: AAA family ATPase [Candidatus Saccharimonadales bacterium]|nr:AAA family ATPase [Candidatus Saccharimonadales bacterium]
MTNQTKLIIFFGLPGTGKTFAGKHFAKKYGFFYYDADDALTRNIVKAVKTQKPITDAMRDVFFEKLNKHLTGLVKKHPKLAISQTFIKEKYRLGVLKLFPNAKFVLVKTPTKLREERLAKRTSFKIEKEYARKMSQRFEKPKIPHFLLENTTEDALERGLNKLHDSLRDISL